MIHIPRLIIAGTHSGVGKTTITTGIMAALTARGLKVQGFKTGPDYIDPGYHTLVTGRPSRNLDAFMLPPGVLVRTFVQAAATADIAIIEGVMGLFDGGAGGVGSTANLAKQLKAPVILVVDIRSMADSAAALVYGFVHYDQAVYIAGVILNHAGSERHYRMVKDTIESKVGIPVIGCLSNQETLALPERHLGLVPVEENGDRHWQEVLAEGMERSVDLTRVRRIAEKATPLQAGPLRSEKQAYCVKIGIARDEAFSFYYQDSRDTLAAQGAEPVYFSPLRQTAIPDVDGLIFGGGFPEMFLAELSANEPMQDSIRRAHRSGMPIYAECGGLMYLCREVADFAGRKHALTGLVPAVCQMQKKRVMVGYVEAEALQDNVLCTRGGVIKGHEFHFSTMQADNAAFNWAFSFKRHRDGSTYPGGYCQGKLLASYLHCHFSGKPAIARHFVAKCREYKDGKELFSPGEK